jgi:hypothetical protein
LPPIPDRLLRGVLYLYPDVTSAAAGENVGGTGFLYWHSEAPFVISAQHVVATGAPVFRLPGSDHMIEVHATHPLDWHRHPDGHDLACYAIPREIAERAGLTPGTAGVLPGDIGLPGNTPIGAEVFLLGRFLGQHHGPHVTPIARFGNVAMLPGAPVIDPRSGISQISYLIDVPSLGGLSGAPVFTYTMHGLGAMLGAPTYMSSPLLLGVDWCHLSDFGPVVDEADAPVPNHLVERPYGLAGVVPAEFVLTLLP